MDQKTKLGPNKTCLMFTGYGTMAMFTAHILDSVRPIINVHPMLMLL